VGNIHIQMVFSSDFFLGWEKFTILRKKIFWKNNILSQIAFFLGEKITKNKIFFCFKNHQKSSLLLMT